ncbi:Protein of unknown function (DUF761 [Striga hermonthica]|uniref:DUF4408 domain-containing protein n=1 Tax=Striga hermonthica TaxID=68872 RepID=A0A9N7R351_STRHE|nr:Protein of unknown function (DUF761 [Striga hermonthica]
MKYQPPTNFMSSLRAVLISTGVLSAAIVLKVSAPAITDLAGCLPSVYNSFISWLRPPYLYLVVNFIIIAILASSKLQSEKYDEEMPSSAASSAVRRKLTEAEISPAHYPTSDYEYDGVSLSGTTVEQGKGSELDSSERADAKEVIVPFVRDATSNKENEFVIGKSTSNGGSAENSPARVRPTVSGRYGHRRNVKASPEGVRTVLGVTRTMMKSDTWAPNNRPRQLPEKTLPPKTMKKAETFNDRTNTRSPSPSTGGPGKLRQEASLSHDELNRRIEAFIKKFNEEMRLQR